MKKIKGILSLVFFLILTWCSIGQENDSLEIKIATYLKPYIDMNAWSGIVSIYENNEAVFQGSYGFADREWKVPNTTNTKFRIASISKLFTEVAILKLVEDGSLSLEDKLSDFIPDYPRGNEIIVKHLLTHKSGIPHLNSFPNYNKLIKFDYEIVDLISLFKDLPLESTPGERYRYSNSGYVLLAYIIEHVSQTSYSSYLNKEIFEPVGLSGTGIDDEKKIIENRAKGYMFDELGNLINAEYVNMDIKIGGGSLYSTVDDLNLFVQKLLEGSILKSTLNELPNFSELDGERLFTANGRVQGFCHQITHRLDQGLTVIVLGNHYSNIALPISDDIFKIFSNKAYNIPENYLSQKITIPNTTLMDYEGTYDFGFGPIGKVKVINGNLSYGPPGRETYDKLIPIGKDTFFYIQSWVLLRFKEKKDKSYNKLEWIMGENVYPAERISAN